MAEGTVSPELGSTLDRIRTGVRAMSPRELVTELAEQFRGHRLLVQASAIAFRAFLALIPLLLFGFGLLGFLGLEEVWRQDIAPDLRDSVSPPAFELIDDAITNVLTDKQLWWVTIGAAIAIWQVSTLVRVNEDLLNDIYGVGEERSARERYLVSFGVAAAVIPLVLAAVVIVRFGPLLLDDLLGRGVLADVVGFAVRWALAGLLLLAAIGLMVRVAPNLERPWGWVTFGSLIVVCAWALMSLLFGLYLTQLADYGSVFGNLATIFVLLEYLFLSAVVFLGGLVIDAAIEERTRLRGGGERRTGAGSAPRRGGRPSPSAAG